MIIKTFTSGPVETHCYLIACPQTKQAAIIDAPQGIAPTLVKEVKDHGFKVQTIFITHSHWDHIADAAKLKRAFEAPLYINSLDADNLKRPGSDKLPMFFSVEGVEADGLLKEGEVFHVGDLELKVIETPGHSPGGVSLWFPKEKVLFSGDTLFRGSMGRIDFPTSSATKMWESLKKLGRLPPDTKVYPGHGPATTIAAEGWVDRAETIFGGNND
jgi:glyoxylase-like metal-dependent hydrolase (beta-lactamase superfamily II)